MTGLDFKNWTAHMDISNRQAALLLGLSRDTVTKYAREGAPRHIGLACAALAHGLTEWRAPE